MKSKKVSFRNNILILQFLGDALFAYVGLSLGYFLRFQTPLKQLGVEPGEVLYTSYLPLFWVGLIILLFAYSQLGVYNWKLILRPNRLKINIIKGTTFWFLIYLGLSLALKFEPAISRMFVVYSWFCVIACMIAWKALFLKLLAAFKLDDELVQQVAVVGWNDDARSLANAVYSDSNHPYDVAGIIASDSSDNHLEKFDNVYPRLGSLDELESILRSGNLDILIIADLDLPREKLSWIASLCEVNYVDLKMAPSMFQIFVSGLRLETISGLPILGIEELVVHRPINQLLKRSTDIIGGIVGLLLFSPVMLVLAMIIRRQDPGPVIYRQTRTGLHGKPFTMYKLRSMKLDAEKETGARWAVENDPRRLPIGAFMRSWNLDELPQFWNVLIGDMSLVGPRPERPELIQKFEKEIDHYNPRHEVKPGITGWAQINGLRGDTSLVERIRFDIYYIENWSWFWDWQIMLFTFFKRDNAY